MNQNKLITDIQDFLIQSSTQQNNKIEANKAERLSTLDFVKTFVGKSLTPKDLHADLTPVQTDFFKRAAILSYETFLEYETAVFQEYSNKETPKKNYLIKKNYKDKKLAVCIAQADKQFIVHTLLLCSRIQSLEIEQILHPIMQGAFIPVSLCYFEIANIKETKIDEFINSLNCSLNELHQATDSFNKITTELKTFVHELSTQQDYINKSKRELINWCLDSNFLIWDLSKFKLVKEKPTHVESTGILELKNERSLNIINQITKDLENLVATKVFKEDSGKELFFSKLNIESIIQRELFLSTITIKYQDTYLVLTGLFGSKVTQQEAKTTPTISQTYERLLASLDFKTNSFDYDYAIDTLDRMPRDCLLRLSKDKLLELISCGISFYSSKRVQISHFADIKDRFTLFLVILPRDRYNSDIRKTIQNEIETRFGAKIKSSEIHIDISLKPQAKLYLSLPIDIGEPDKKLITEIEEFLSKEIAKPKDRFIDSISTQEDLKLDTETVDKYWNYFEEELIATTKESELVEITKSLEAVSEEKLFDLKLLVDKIEDHDNKRYNYKVFLTTFAKAPLTVSKSLPVFQNLGFEVITANTYPIKELNKNIHIFDINSKINIDEQIQSKLPSSLENIFSGQIDNDILNSLLLHTGFSTKKIQLLRTYACALFQMDKSYRLQSIYETLTTYPNISRLIKDYFNHKFDPKFYTNLDLSFIETIKQSQSTELNKIKSDFFEELKNVTEVSKDKIFRSIFTILTNTVRTNFFHSDTNISLKIYSKDISFIAEPRPLFEIFTKSPHFEGVHLRSDKVVRGGIRWSERPDDYRNEIHGLMKTQMSKNVIIVPGGAKGGFIVRNLPKEQKEIPFAVENCYKDFVRGCLSLADNYDTNGKIVHPKGLVVHDEPDPYFVMAADKGTATFSDIANSIAQNEFGFWLEDAFASGGSNGYDHKKYGITARGAWESVKRHLKDLGIDFDAHPISVVGIGDLSGDVFGNGLIYSNKLKLIAAFNHKHIFIDPNPDPEASFKERVRLFTTPKTQWSDYNPKLISKGGAIFLRTEKEIALTPEIRKALSIQDKNISVVNGEELVSLVLKADCDLIWNGGIGTYVKSSTESNADVLDATNDSVRINASELRAKVIGEGGNLGLSQKARIEYSQRGGKINTDAIDNSGGVDLSDHEVNIKILFQKIVKSGRLTKEERNKILLQIADEVVNSVLKHNRSHAIALTIFDERSVKSLTYIENLLKTLEKAGFVSRKTDGLPDYDGIKERQRKNLGLTRPELANLLAKIKMWIKSSLLKSDFLDSKFLNDYLIDYFPESLREKYKSDVYEHPLAKNIIATELTGIFINSIGLTFIHRLSQQFSIEPSKVIQYAVAADQLIGFRAALNSIDILDSTKNNLEFLAARRHISKALRLATTWIAHLHGNDSVESILELYKWPYFTLTQSLETVFNAERLQEINKIADHYKSLGIEKSASERLGIYEHIIDVMQLLIVARLSAMDIKDVGNIYFEFYDSLRLKELVSYDGIIPATNKWEHEILQTAFTDIPQIAEKLSVDFLNSVKNNGNYLTLVKDEIKQIKSTSSYEAYDQAINDFCNGAKNISQFLLIVNMAKKI